MEIHVLNSLAHSLIRKGKLKRLTVAFEFYFDSIEDLVGDFV